MSVREEWLKKQNVNQRDRQLLKRASEILEDNILKEGPYPWGSLRGIVPSTTTYAGVWNWDSAFHAIATSRWDAELGYEQCDIFMDSQLDNGMLIDMQFANGKIGDGASKPPVFPWAFCEVYKRKPDRKRLLRAYDSYSKMENYWVQNRKTGPLFHYDAAYDDGHVDMYAKCESGWDTSVRFDNGVTNLWAIDLNCYMIMTYKALAFMAEELHLNSSIWQAKEAELINAVNQYLWDDNIGFCDAYSDTHRVSGILSPASFMPLFVGFASDKQAEKMAQAAKDRNKFFPGMPTVSYDNAKYNSTDYWRGPTWLNTAYFALKGLKNYGYTETAETIKEVILNWCSNEKRGIFEYYNSKTGEGLGALNFGWSCAFIIEFILNF